MKNILWLDDDYYRLQDLASILELNGYNVIFCSNIPSAIRIIEDNKDFSLFILDMNMSPSGLPENEVIETKGGIATGYVFYKNYLQPRFITVPTIILSAYPHDMYINVNERYKNITCLKKPIDSEELIKIIESKIKPAANNHNNYFNAQ